MIHNLDHYRTQPDLDMTDTDMEETDMEETDTPFEKPDFLQLAEKLISGSITDTTKGLNPDDGVLNDALRELMHHPTMGGMSGEQLSLVAALADYAAKAIVDLSAERNEPASTTWDNLSDPFLQGGYPGPVTVRQRPSCPLHDHPQADGDNCTCGQ